MSTINKKLEDMSRNRSFLISKVGKIVRLLLLSQAAIAKNNSIFFAFKHAKTYLNYGKQPTAH